LVEGVWGSGFGTIVLVRRSPFTVRRAVGSELGSLAFAGVRRVVSRGAHHHPDANSKIHS